MSSWQNESVWKWTKALQSDLNESIRRWKKPTRNDSLSNAKSNLSISTRNVNKIQVELVGDTMPITLVLRRQPHLPSIKCRVFVSLVPNRVLPNHSNRRLWRWTESSSMSEHRIITFSLDNLLYQLVLGICGRRCWLVTSSFRVLHPRFEP